MVWPVLLLTRSKDKERIRGQALKGTDLNSAKIMGWIALK
jgi:hypothetical protein